MSFQMLQSQFLCSGGVHQCLIHYGYRLDGVFGKTEHELYEIGLSLYPEHMSQFGVMIIQNFLNPVTDHQCCA